MPSHNAFVLYLYQHLSFQCAKQATPKSVIPKGCNFETTLLFSNGVRNQFKFNKKALGVETRTDAQGLFFFKFILPQANQPPQSFQQ